MGKLLRPVCAQHTKNTHILMKAAVLPECVSELRVERVLEPCQRVPAKRGWVGGPRAAILLETPLFSTVQVQLQDRECVCLSLCFENNVGGLKSRFGAWRETSLGACGEPGPPSRSVHLLTFEQLKKM